MAFIRGITTFKVNDSVLVQNISTPGFDNYILRTIDGSTYTTISDNFQPGNTTGFYYSTEGSKILRITAEKIINGISYSSSASVTFSVGYAPNFDLSYPQAVSDKNYVKVGLTFGITLTQQNKISSPATYTWSYGGAVTYSSSSTIPNIIKYDTIGTKVVGLTVTNPYGTDFSSIVFNVIDTPIISIKANPTFGNIVVGEEFSVGPFLQTGNGHLSGDFTTIWVVDGVTYQQENVTSSFGSSGTKGITLNYYSKLLSGLSGTTYGQYTVVPSQLGLYVDPELVIAFGKDEPEYSVYENEILTYATKYKFMTPVQVGDVASSTYDACILRYETFTEDEKNGPIMVNAEYPWLSILSQGNDESINPSLQTNQTVVQEAQRQKITIVPGLTLYKQLAVNCWRDVVDELRNRGSSKIVHYATTGLAFADYTGVPQGYLAYGPLTGITTDHYWYQGDPVYNKTMREKFDFKIVNNGYGELLKANSNADSFAAAAFSFVPNHGLGLCGIDDWASASIILRGYSAGTGTTFTNTKDFTQQILEDSVKITIGRMWKEFYRACVETQKLNLCNEEDIPENIAVILKPTNYAFFVPDSPGGGWLSTFKWNGVFNKGITKTIENEIAAIFSDQPRVNLYGYTGDVKPKEIWIWDSVNYYYIKTPTRAIANPALYSPNNISVWMTRNYLEKEFFERPNITGGSPLWSSGSTLDQANYFKNNCLSDYYWNVRTTPWWGYSGGTLTNLLPSPCNLNQSLAIASRLNFTQPIYQSDIINALKHEISQYYVNFITKARETLDNSV